MSKQNLNKKSATVSTAANIALVKYWGKANLDSNQPATGSLSIGLEDLRTTTTLTCADGDTDTFEGELKEDARQRATRFLDRVRQTYGIDQPLHVKTVNNFPTGTGLASSASGFAALTLAFDALFGLELTGKTLSRVARLGSGSAARSLYGGFVEIVPTVDAYALEVLPAGQWPLDIIVAVVDEGPKSIGSTEAMIRTERSSPFYQDWLGSHPTDMDDIKQAISDRDFMKMAEISERNCLKMHATMMTSQPPIIYWQPTTIEIIHKVQALRAEGFPAFFTIDAGAQVKIVCLPEATSHVGQSMDSITGIKRLIQTTLGGSPSVTLS